MVATWNLLTPSLCAQAYARAEAERIALPLLPRIVSFQKFSKQELLTVKEQALDRKRRKWSDGVRPGQKQFSPAGNLLDSSGAGRRKSSIKEHKAPSADRGQSPRAAACTHLANNLEPPQQVSDPLGQTFEIPAEMPVEEVRQHNQEFQAHVIDGHVETCNPAQTSSPSQATGNNASLSMKHPHDAIEMKKPGGGHCQLHSSSEQNKGIVISEASILELKLQDDHFKDLRLQHHLQRENSGSVHDHFMSQYDVLRSERHEQSRLLPEKSKSQEDLLRLQNGHNLKKAVAEYIGDLLMPLYKSRKIRKEDYKAILRSATAKVIFDLCKI